MAAQHPTYEAESVEESPMMPAACGQPGEGTVATDDMFKPWCRDSVPLGSRNPNTESYNNENTAPEPLLAMKKKAAIASMPYQNGGVTAIASSMSTSETQTAAVPPQRPGHEVNDGVTSREEPGSVKGALAAEPSDHQMEGDDENGNGEQRQEHGGLQATQAVVMRHDLARPSASLPGAAEQSDHQTEGSEERDRTESHEEVNMSHSQVMEAAAMPPDSARSLPRGSPRLQRERSHGRHGEDGPAIMHDGVDFVVDLRRAREQAGQWRTSNRVCWEENPPISVEPCGHHIVCPRCFHGPYPGSANSRCPVCSQPIEGYKFNQAMLDLFVRRSSKK